MQRKKVVQLCSVSMILISAFFTACKKASVVGPQEKPPVVSTEDQKKIKINKKVDSIKASLVQKKFNITSFELNKDSTSVIFSYEVTASGAAEFGILDAGSSADYYYGKPIHGREFLETGEPNYFNSQIPLNQNQHTTIKGGNGEILSKAVNKLALSSMRVQVAQARESLGGSQGLSNKKGEIKYTISTFNKYADIKNEVLFNSFRNGLRNNMNSKEVKKITDFTSDETSIGFKSGVYLFFRQDSYTALLDDSAPDWKLYDKEIDPAFFVNKVPAYISEVIFGRYGVLAVESALYSNEQVKEALNAALKDTTSMTEIQKKIMNTSTIRTFDNDVNFHPFGSGMETLGIFLNIAKNNLPNGPKLGENPIYFRVKSLKDKKLLTGGKYKYSEKFDL